ncbi:MAG TPA: cell division protein FtsL [Candidatus Acidoferrales bacterium]|nr:cell division protein FtsL [Candidatus Acidoferrales bacterium]
MAIWATNLPELLSGPVPQQSTLRKYMPGAPEIFLVKPVDNSRLVRVADKKRRREMYWLTAAMVALFSLVMLYVVQHCSAVEYGYKIEELRKTRDALMDTSKTLRLEEASLKDPQRIDSLARSMGMQLPQAGQVQRVEPVSTDNTPVMARAVGLSVVSMPQ